jgi:hypothetical protein
MSNAASPWRPEFLKAVELLARVSEAMHERGLPRPVLVGGGAAEYYSGSALMTGDIDVTSPVQEELEEELHRSGFVRPSGAGQSLRGWVHPKLAFGFEIVADLPMDGSVDSGRIRLVRPEGGSDLFRVISVEDLIADRMGQFASGSAREMLAQALALLSLYPDVDKAYLDRRIRDETLGDHGIEVIST